ncbi:hypothetical protein ACK3SF_01830 [Candidatus Nanosalina sp. VS9-1]|uniref:hypothetical protein n=1 Tax=Candidatus Nanosalina sp. VS9-1 TaxID=3388566 RepID=UPI0039E1421F
MNRNKALLLGLLAFVAVSSGCIDAEASLRMEKVEGAELGEKASVNISDMHADFRKVADNGSFLTTENPPSDVLDHGVPVLYKGSLYSLNRTVAGTEDRIGVTYSAERVQDSQSSEVNLTDGEKDFVDSIFDQASAGSNISRIKYYRTYTLQEKEESVLADRNETVITRGDSSILVTKNSEENTTTKVYNYTARKVAENLSEYSSELRDRYLFELDTSNLSEQFLQKAIDETYYGDETEEMKRVVEALKKGRPFKKEFRTGTWIVSYRDSTYWTEARAPSLERQIEKIR